MQRTRDNSLLKYILHEPLNHVATSLAENSVAMIRMMPSVSVAFIVALFHSFIVGFLVLASYIDIGPLNRKPTTQKQKS